MLDAPSPLPSQPPQADGENKTPSPPASQTSPLALARAFLVAHGQGLAKAAELLGGPRWSGRCHRLASDLRRVRLTSGQVLRELEHLHQLLSLEFVGNPDREETERFALLHPDSEEADDIRLLAEALDQAIGRIRQAMEAAGGPTPTLVIRMAPGSEGTARVLAARQRPVGPGTQTRHPSSAAPAPSVPGPV